MAKGTEIAKLAASHLINDDLQMVDAVAMEGNLYQFKSYLIYNFIHIPIFTVVYSIGIGWVYPNIFSPIHIIFLELVMVQHALLCMKNEQSLKRIQ
jgi:Ca2+-transporting ATPase